VSETSGREQRLDELDFVRNACLLVMDVAALDGSDRLYAA